MTPAPSAAKKSPSNDVSLAKTLIPSSPFTGQDPFYLGHHLPGLVEAYGLWRVCLPVVTQTLQPMPVSLGIMYCTHTLLELQLGTRQHPRSCGVLLDICRPRIDLVQRRCLRTQFYFPRSSPDTKGGIKRHPSASQGFVSLPVNLRLLLVNACTNGSMHRQVVAPGKTHGDLDIVTPSMSQVSNSIRCHSTFLSISTPGHCCASSL